MDYSALKIHREAMSSLLKRKIKMGNSSWSQIARELGLSRFTVLAWPARGMVPENYQSFVYKKLGITRQELKELEKLTTMQVRKAENLMRIREDRRREDDIRKIR